ncbi:MAG: isocitrate lyase/phosphoenolpyruvate mutase family protein [Pseudomonadota bacterium]
MTNSDSASAFTAMHKRGNPLVLYNIWDAGSACAVVRAGATAVATGSASVAAAHGYDDGEALPLAELKATIERITAAVTVPISVDMESGYGESPGTVGQTAVVLAAAGAVGCNFEDQRIARGGVFSIATQCDRLAGIRTALADANLPMHINARTDVFLQQPDQTQHRDLLPAAIDRAKAYAEAGADSFFAPWLADIGLIETLCESVPLPVNIMWRDGVAAIADLARAGVARVSYGPGPYRQVIAGLEAAAAAVYR